MIGIIYICHLYTLYNEIEKPVDETERNAVYTNNTGKRIAMSITFEPKRRPKVACISLLCINITFAHAPSSLMCYNIVIVACRDFDDR